MAIEIRFHDLFIENEDYIQCKAPNQKGLSNGVIEITGFHNEEKFCVCLDIPTAIKFAKTLRTEINKAKAEVDNG